MLNSKVYDVLKFIAQIALPALGTLYFALASIWGFPYGEQIVGTIAAVDTFLGAILGISSKNYYEMINQDSAAEWEPDQLLLQELEDDEPGE